MTTVLRYRLRCTTEDAYKYVWAEEGDAVPSQCPEDSGHTIDANQTTVVGRVGSSQVHIAPTVGGALTWMHGVSEAGVAGQWKRLDISVPAPVHVQEVKVQIVNGQVGDYGFLSIIHPLGTTNPSQAVGVDDTTVTLPSAEVAAVYAVSQHMEFWNDGDDVLVERRPVVSVEGAVVTLGEAVKHVHTTSAVLRASLACYSPDIGDDNVDGGVRQLDDYPCEIKSENEFTDPVPADVILGARFSMSSEVADRKIAVNYRLRVCSGPGGICGCPSS